jgi:hypothetical protein
MDIEVVMMQLRQSWKGLRLGIKSLVFGSCPNCGNSDKTKIKPIGTDHNRSVLKYCKKCHHQW